MVRASVGNLPDHPFPKGVEIRPVSEDQLRTIWEAERRPFAITGGTSSHRGVLASLVVPYRDLLWKIAWDDEGVAGQVRSFIDTAQNSEHDLRRG